MFDNNPATIRALGEIAIRCNDLIKMRDFYRDIVGLNILKDFSDDGGTVFFRISEGYRGHTSVLALFDKMSGDNRGHPTGNKPPQTGALSSFHHMALSVDYDAQNELRDFFDEKGILHRTEVFDWIGWRGVFINDPEGNTIEFVACAEKLYA